MKARHVVATFVFLSLLGGMPSWVWAQDFSDVVREEKAKLVAAGYNFHTVSPDDPDGSEASRRGAAEITWRVAHRLSQQGHPVFLIGKTPGQNGATWEGNGQRYSHDAIVFAGTCIDMLFHSETENIPAWNVCTNPTVDPSVWRPTFALEALPTPGPSPVIVAPPSTSSVDLSIIEAKIDRLAADLAKHEAAEAEFRAHAKGIWEHYFRPLLSFSAKYLAPAVVAFLTGKEMAQ